MELCLLVGFTSPDEMRERLTLGQLARWRQFISQVPVGERREDLRSAQLIAYVRTSGGARYVRPSDHLMDFYPRVADETSVIGKLRAGLAACRGNLTRSG